MYLLSIISVAVNAGIGKPSWAGPKWWGLSVDWMWGNDRSRRESLQ